MVMPMLWWLEEVRQPSHPWDWQVFRTCELCHFEVMHLSRQAGLLTLTEMVDCLRRIVDAVDIPVFADGDTGHGGVLNVMRTVKEYERAGVAGMHIEDQEIPKRCGHLFGKALVPPSEMVGKIKAALDARNDGTFTGHNHGSIFQHQLSG